VALCLNNPDLRARKILQMFGLKKILEFVTPRELKVLVAHFNSRSLQRIMTAANQIKLPKANNPLCSIREKIVEFKPCKL
jgi:hypothetical protein